MAWLFFFFLSTIYSSQVEQSYPFHKAFKLISKSYTILQLTRHVTKKYYEGKSKNQYVQWIRKAFFAWNDCLGCLMILQK